MYDNRIGAATKGYGRLVGVIGPYIQGEPTSFSPRRYLTGILEECLMRKLNLLFIYSEIDGAFGRASIQAKLLTYSVRCSRFNIARRSGKFN